jgi:O-antigen/teichoic acid export membrane protein
VHTHDDMAHIDQNTTAANAEQIIVRGARTTFLGFVLRLGGRFPFLLIAGHFYGKEALGIFAYATAVVELAALMATMGLKRGLLLHLNNAKDPHVAAAEALLLTMALALGGAIFFMLLPGLVFPGAKASLIMQVFPLVMLGLVLSDMCLAALSHYHMMMPQVVARALVEPWVLTLTAGALAFTPFKYEALFIAYGLAMSAAAAVSLFYFCKHFHLSAIKRVKPANIIALARQSTPVWLADIVEIGQRRVDVLILGQMAGPAVVGLYYAGQQVATLVSRMRGSFEPILTPVMAKLSAAHEKTQAALALDQVRFWLYCAQLAVMLALGLYAKSIMTMIGPEFGSGATIMILLLLAELFWGVLGIAELPLLFARAKTNVLIGLLAIGVEIILALLLVPRFAGVGAAIALSGAFLLAGIIKTVLASRQLGVWPHPARMFWPSVFGAVAVGPSYWLAAKMSFPASMLAGIPLFLLLYGLLLWYLVFTDADRMLFRKLT